MMGFRFIIIGFLAVSLKSVQSLSDQEKQNILTFVLPALSECAKVETLSDSTIETVLRTGDLKIVSPCLLSCVTKYVGMLNDKGLFDTAKSNEIAKQFLSEEDYKTVPESLEKCAKINDVAVSDGEKGCERVTLLLNCASSLLAILFPTR